MNGVKFDNVPILGRRIDDEGITTIEDVLAKLRSGDLLNVAVVGEQRDGNMLMSVSGGHGCRMRLRGALGTLAAMVDRAIVG